MNDAELTRRYWHPIAHASELATPGDYVRLSWLGGEDVIAWCGPLGEAVVFDNRCPHRGTRIIDQRFGNRKLVCPYHGWSWPDGYGPARVREPALFDPRTLALRSGLTTYNTRWCRHWLFFAIAPAATLEEQLGAAFMDAFGDVSTRIEQRADFNARTWGCDWRVAVENALEDYHVPVVHRKSLGLLNIANETVTRSGHNTLAAYTVNDERIKALIRLLAPKIAAGRPIPAPSGYFTFHLHPFAQLSSTAGLSYALQLWLPDGRRTAFSSRTYRPRPAGTDAAQLIEFTENAAALNRQVFDEDRDACERLRWVDHPILGAAEGKVAAFRAAIGPQTGETA